MRIDIEKNEVWVHPCERCISLSACISKPWSENDRLDESANVVFPCVVCGRATLSMDFFAGETAPASSDCPRVDRSPDPKLSCADCSRHADKLLRKSLDYWRPLVDLFNGVGWESFDGAVFDGMSTAQNPWSHPRGFQRIVRNWCEVWLRTLGLPGFAPMLDSTISDGDSKGVIGQVQMEFLGHVVLICDRYKAHGDATQASEEFLQVVNAMRGSGHDWRRHTSSERARKKFLLSRQVLRDLGVLHVNS